MRHRIEGNQLVVEIDDDDKKQILERREEKEETYPGTDGEMYDVFECLICNSELDWISPDETADLTDAPMLGIRDNERPNDFGGEVLHHWAFMGYAVRSPVDDLLNHGKAVFVGE